jgi:predicted ATPase
MAEAIAVLKTGLELVPRLPSRDDAESWELELQVLLGHAFRAARAPSAPETGQAWDRAYELCRTRGDDAHLQQVLYGQFLFHQGNANLKEARRLGEELLALAEKHQDSSAFIRGHSAVGRTAFGQGDFSAARHHLEQALSVPKDPASQASTSIHGPESRVLNLCYLAWTLFIQGQCAEGLARCFESTEAAARLAQPYDIVVSHGNACYTHHFRRDLEAVSEHAGTVMALAEEQGFAAWLSLGHIFQGWCLVQTGDIATGLPMIEHALAEHRATGERLEVPYFYGLLAECYGKAGRPEDGLRAIEDAIALSQDTGEAWFDAELFRLRGELCLAVPSGEPADALAWFQRALDLAHAQGARLWEMRARLSASRCGQDPGPDETGEPLEPPIRTAADAPDRPDRDQAPAMVAGTEAPPSDNPV